MAAREEVEAEVVLFEDGHQLDRVAPGVFDGDVEAGRVAAFLEDPRHHMAIAMSGNLVVGMATAVEYVHPDKPAELWINEVGVAPTFRGAGLGRRLVACLLEHGGRRGCKAAWVLTDEGNEPACRLFRGLGGRPSGAQMFEFTIEGEDPGLAGDKTTYVE